jgi:hypothetical protein
MSGISAFFPSYNPWAGFPKPPGIGEIELKGFTSDSSPTWNGINVTSVVRNDLPSAWLDATRGVVVIPPGTYDIFAQVQHTSGGNCILRMIDYKHGSVEIMRSPAQSSPSGSGYVSVRMFGRLSLPQGAEVNLTAFFTLAGTSNIKDQQLRIRRIA